MLKTSLLFVLCLCLTGCGLSAQTQYEQAQWHLGAGEYAAAHRLFADLGSFADAQACALYCSALTALENGDLDRARADFTNLEGRYQSALYLRWLDAHALEAQGRLEEAREGYLALGSFYDSPQRALRMNDLIPQRDYRAAVTLKAAGEWLQAWELFSALGDYEDSAAQALACQERLFETALSPIRLALEGNDHARALELLKGIDLPLTPTMEAQLEQLQTACHSALYARAVRAEAGGLPAAREAIALYEGLGDHEDSPQRAAALRERYGRSLALQPGQLIQLGRYPQPLLWQVVKVYEGRALLLSQRILAARPLCREGETFTAYDRSSLKAWLEGDFKSTAFDPAALKALEGPFLLSREEALLLTDAQRRAAATPAALEEGLRLSDEGYGWWWLRDQGHISGCQAIVYFSGLVYEKGVQAHDAQTGVRPALWLDLEQYPLTQGSGSEADPYR